MSHVDMGMFGDLQNKCLNFLWCLLNLEGTLLHQMTREDCFNLKKRKFFLYIQ